MGKKPTRTSAMARRDISRRAMSLLELTTVIAMIGLLTVASIARYGHSSVGNGGAEGFARKLSLTLLHARRSTISTGENHYVRLTSSGGSVSSFALFRRVSKGNLQVDATHAVPQDVTVASKSTELEFDFEGSALAGYSVGIAGPDRSWNVSVVMLTGMALMTEATP